MRPTIPAYFRERMNPLLFVPVILLLAHVACWTSHTITFPTFGHACGLVALLVVQFRLWDDLADRERDRANFPERVLVRAEPAPFVILVVSLALSALAAAWFIGGIRSFIALAILNVAFVLLYAVVRRHLSDGLWRYPVLLSKYPAFVVITAVALDEVSLRRAVVTVLFVYAAALAYEALHSRRSAPQSNPDTAA